MNEWMDGCVCAQYDNTMRSPITRTSSSSNSYKECKTLLMLTCCMYLLQEQQYIYIYRW